MKKLKPKVQLITCTSIVTEDTVLEGDYEGKADLCIAGTINGDVDVKGTVFVDSTGNVVGSVNGASVIVSGKISGNVTAKKEVELRDGAKVGGYVVSREAHVSPGAKVEGEVYSAKKGPFVFDVKVNIA
ncbi:MAG: polymer-forming cytoskeletal protein [bacterium]|nr:polymer-forming cytoskeletal protein [bacterium]